ncbi:MAG: argininosuccinate synthase [Methylacidiphilales bacterium]|nr:argininosuccinate synthase [Candidatus Methylacidiphilales bacterium]
MKKPLVVLAYSGGLDTSIILKWLQEERNADVICFTADIGQGEEVEPARAKALALNAKEVIIENLQEIFVKEFVFPMFRANALYEGEYLLGTSIARPLIAQRLVEIAKEKGADAISHGATGKGNDQIRFELSAYSLHPDIAIIAPWREWNLSSRTALLEYAKRHAIPISQTNNKPPYSMDANLLHISYEGGILEDAWQKPEESMWRRTTSLNQCPTNADEITIQFENGDPVAINGKIMSPANLLTELNRIAGLHCIGRVDIVENRYIGLKSRGCYETPGGTVLFRARRALESIVLDREEMHLKDDLQSRYARLVYNGYWFSPERTMLQKLIDTCAQKVEGEVRLELFRGSVMINGRRSNSSLYQATLSSFEDDKGSFDQKDASGFITLQSIRLKTYSSRKKV